MNNISSKCRVACLVPIPIEGALLFVDLARLATPAHTLFAFEDSALLRQSARSMDSFVAWS